LDTPRKGFILTKIKDGRKFSKDLLFFGDLGKKQK